jgi:hypothetical protein
MKKAIKGCLDFAAQDLHCRGRQKIKFEEVWLRYRQRMAHATLFFGCAPRVIVKQACLVSRLLLVRINSIGAVVQGGVLTSANSIN